MDSNYTNLNAEETYTPWKSYGHSIIGDTYYDNSTIGNYAGKANEINLDGSYTIEGYELGYTKIIKELPSVAVDNTNYWINPPIMQTKFATYISFSTQYNFYLPSFKVYINNIIVDSSLVTPTPVGGPYTGFTLDNTVIDGYMYVEYISVTPSIYAGDNTATINTNSIYSEYITPVIFIDEIVRCRNVILNLQLWSGYSPSNWIGGPFNNLKSSSNNLINHTTPIYAQHILEIQAMIIDLSVYFNTISTYSIAAITFDDYGVVNNQVYSIKYVEDIRRGLSILEYHALAMST